MNEATATAEVKAQETAEVKAAAPIKAEVPKLGVKDFARLLAEKTPLAVKETETDVYQVFTTKENGKMNWRKGLIYQVFRYAKGLVSLLRRVYGQFAARVRPYVEPKKNNGFTKETIAPSTGSPTSFSTFDDNISF